MFTALARFDIRFRWLVIGLWNSVIGFCLMRFARHPVAAIFPGAARIRGDEPVTAKTAILVCIRNEAPDRVIRNLAPLMSGLAGAGTAEPFDVYVLSDTSDPALAANEEARFDALAAEWGGRMAVVLDTGAATGD